ncbi:FAD-binding protein [Corynebacterium belfantii]|uniref:FAD-dependent oxidoreductase n=1 Tax=Corynebacterium belfantii TaxID=2014537 RepID=UPI0018D3C956|nr:FAD-binding protein [Corynebacterium belfantii]
MGNNDSCFSPLSNTDVLVIGAGGAGLSAALEAAALGARVEIFTRNMYTSANNRWSSGGGCTWKTTRIQCSRQRRRQYRSAYIGYAKRGL